MGEEQGFDAELLGQAECGRKRTGIEGYHAVYK